MNDLYLGQEGYDSYRSIDLETKAATASPYELVLVLFDGLLDELARARSYRSKTLPGKRSFIGKVHEHY
jgi:flagellar protein FliS